MFGGVRMRVVVFGPQRKIARRCIAHMGYTRNDLRAGNAEPIFPPQPMFGGSAVPLLLQVATVLPRRPHSSCSSRPLSACLERSGLSPRVCLPVFEDCFFGHAHWRLCARGLVILFEPLPPWRRPCLGFGLALSPGGLEGFWPGIH
jgi:hypothetical protein